MRTGEQVILRTVQQQGFACLLMERVKDCALIGEKAERLVWTTLTHHLGTGIPRAAVSV
jgi:hypothetical protein